MNDRELSFAYVTESSTVDQLKVAAERIRDIDLLKDTLGTLKTFEFLSRELSHPWLICSLITGTVKSPLFLTSKHFVPERIMNQIDKRTQWMLEGGFNQFYDSLGKHLAKVRARRRRFNDDEEYGGDNFGDYDDAVPALSIGYFLITLQFLLIYEGIALIILIVEIIVYNFNWRRNRRFISPLPMNIADPQ